MNHYILDRVWKGMRQPTVRRVGVTLLGLALLQDPSISLAQVISIQAKQESLNQIFEKLKKRKRLYFLLGRGRFFEYQSQRFNPRKYRAGIKPFVCRFAFAVHIA